MRRVVFITQQVDAAHPVLAATVPMIAALARRVDEVIVLADAAVPGALPANCRVRSFRAGSRLGRGLRFERALAPELRGASAVVAHMCPIYAVLAAPLARPLGVPVVLWFNHWRASRLLRLAERVSSAVVTAYEGTFPLRSDKLEAIGHGIDVGEFACTQADGASGRLRALALGRYSDAKGYETMLQAVRLAADRGLEVGLQVVGPVSTDAEREHRARLQRLVGELGLGDRVALGDAVPRSRIPSVIAAADVLVNNMRAGAADKVVYEACASCVPVIASNPVFDGLLPDSLRFARDDPAGLAERLREFAGLDAAARSELGRALRGRVEREHSVDSWADGVLAAAGLR